MVQLYRTEAQPLSPLFPSLFLFFIPFFLFSFSLLSPYLSRYYVLATACLHTPCNKLLILIKIKIKIKLIVARDTYIFGYCNSVRQIYSIQKKIIIYIPFHLMASHPALFSLVSVQPAGVRRFHMNEPPTKPCELAMTE